MFYDKYEQFMDLKILLMHKYTLLNVFKDYTVQQNFGDQPTAWVC